MAVTTRRASWRDARGAELIEFAIVLPIFVLLTAAIFDFGMMFRTYEAVTNAAREGARVGVLPTYQPTDVQARWAAQRLNQAWGQPAVVDNRPGAGGVTGTDLVAKAPADGYTLVGGNPGPLTVAPNLQLKMPYQTERDFTPVVLLATASSMLCVHPSVPARNVKESVPW